MDRHRINLAYSNFQPSPLLLNFTLISLIAHFSYHLIALRDLVNQVDWEIKNILSSVRNKLFVGYDYLFKDRNFACDHLIFRVLRSRDNLFHSTRERLKDIDLRLISHLNSKLSTEAEISTLEPNLKKFHMLTLNICNFYDSLQNILPLIILLEKKYTYSRFDIKIFENLKSVLREYELNSIKDLVHRSLRLYKIFAQNNNASFQPTENLPPLHSLRKQDVINVIVSTEKFLKLNREASVVRANMPYHPNAFNKDVNG